MIAALCGGLHNRARRPHTVFPGVETVNGNAFGPQDPGSTEARQMIMHYAHRFILGTA